MLLAVVVEAEDFEAFLLHTDLEKLSAEEAEKVSKSAQEIFAAGRPDYKQLKERSERQEEEQ